MDAYLSTRAGQAIGKHEHTPEEQDRVVAAANVTASWDELDPEVRALIEEIESRPLMPGEVA